MFKKVLNIQMCSVGISMFVDFLSIYFAGIFVFILFDLKQILLSLASFKMPFKELWLSPRSCLKITFIQIDIQLSRFIVEPISNGSGCTWVIFGANLIMCKVHIIAKTYHQLITDLQ